jgi:hypothetical protein
MRSLCSLLKTQKGQTATEYLLMLFVAATLGMTAFKKLQAYLLTNPNSVIGKPLSDMKKKLQENPRYERTPFKVRK